MVAALSTTTTTPNLKVLSRGPAPAPAPAKPKREPLLPSEADNSGPPLPRRSKSRDVTSRYLSSTASSTSTTTTTNSTSSSSSNYSTMTTSSSNSMATPRKRPPLVTGTHPMTPASVVNNRAQSAERRRPGAPGTGEMSASAKMLTSMRSLSVSFQGESFAFPVSKSVKPAPSASSNGLRNGTPERRKAVTPVRKSEESKLIDQQRWPRKLRQESFLTRSVDFTKEKMKLSGPGTGSAVRALQKSMVDETKLKPNERETPEFDKRFNKLVADTDNSNIAISDTESVSFGSTPANVRGGGPRAIVVPARFWQETVNRLRRVQPEPVSPPLSKNNKPISKNKFINDGPTLYPRGSLSSPVGGAVRPASPIKRVISSSTSSPSRGIPTSSRELVGVGSNNLVSNTPSILSFAAEARRGKVGENKLVDAHVLRLLHNNHLQWRFINARADAAMLVQRTTAQKSLYNAWVTTSKMWQSVISKRLEIQQLKQNLKLQSVIKKQMRYLDVWDQTDRDHSISLSGAIVALESSTLRLPVIGGAKADIQNLKDAISSAVDVMQAIESSACTLLYKVGDVNSLASELACTTRKECSLLDQCKDILSTLTHMEVQDCSLRTHTLQLQS